MCNFFAAVIEAKEGGIIRLASEKHRLIHGCLFVSEAPQGRKSAGAMLSSKLINDPDTQTVMESHKFKVTRASIQGAPCLINGLNQAHTLTNSAAYRASIHMSNYISGDHRHNFGCIQSITDRACSAGHASEIHSEVVDAQGTSAYRGFMLAPRSSMETESFLRAHIYMDMSHVFNSVGGFISGMRYLDGDGQIVVLAILHCKSKSEHNVSEFSEFSENNFPDIAFSPSSTVNAEGYKGVTPSVDSVLQSPTWAQKHSN